MVKFIFGAIVGSVVMFAMLDPSTSAAIETTATDLKDEGVQRFDQAKYDRCSEQVMGPCFTSMAKEMGLEDLVGAKSDRLKRQCTNVVTNVCGKNPSAESVKR